jgi:hypothetical protein
VVFLDLAKAFDTVSHKHISEGLKRFRVNSHFIDAVVDLYTDASTHFTLAKGERPKIPMTRGVKQGGPLSPLLLNVAMDPLLEVDGQELPLIAPADGTKYLGVKVNNWTGVPKKTQAKNLNSGVQE